MFALNLLSIALAYRMLGRTEMSLIGSPSIGIKLSNPKRF